MLTDEQKKDPKIIDLVSHLPFTFDEEIERMLEEKEKQKENETFQRQSAGVLLPVLRHLGSLPAPRPNLGGLERTPEGHPSHVTKQNRS